MQKPLDKICFTNRKRMVIAIQRLLDAGEEDIVVRIETLPEKIKATDAGLPDGSIRLTDFEAEAVAEWLKGQ